MSRTKETLNKCVMGVIGSFARKFHIGFDPTMNITKNTRPVYNETPDHQLVVVIEREDESE